jgi:2-polyprenyl-6-methoxyphenol hydroxylase-like FAD-dependent oxidoreductase
MPSKPKPARRSIISERIVVIGAGAAGLLAALMLASDTRTLTLLDRDPPPPEDDGAYDAAFEHWHRRGVGQLRHSHAFLARLVNIIRTHHPALMNALIAAGCREMTLADLLPSTLKDRYTPEPGDVELSILMSRRVTFELVLRRYVLGLPCVTLRSDAFVAGYDLEPGAPPRVKGVILEDGEVVLSDLVVDASGRTAQTAEWLSSQGIIPLETGEPAGILYYTRHWRLNADQTPPPRNGSPGAGDLGYIKFGLFEADNGWFSVTLAVPEVETELRAAIVHPDTFDAICLALPGVAPWIDPEHARPQSKVFAMGDLSSRWLRMVADGKPLVENLFLIGDGLIRSNPLYGRGTSFAAIEAELLARALAAGRDPTARALLYDSLVEQALRPFYDDMLGQDRSAIARAAAARAGERGSLRGQLVRSFIRDGAGVAVRDDLPAFRAALRAFHMLDKPRAWLTEPRHIGVMLKAWARGKRRNAHLYPGHMGPERAEMLAVLELDNRTDIAA